MAYPDRKILLPAPAPLEGVIFPTRRRTVGQAGRDVANFCQNIIRDAGSIQRALFVEPERPKTPERATGRIACSITLLWENPRVPIGQLCPDLPQRVNGQE